MASITDVARVAGVSTSTVSHVINGTRHVEQVTRDKVLAAVEQTSYRQDALARSLRRSRTDTIGLVVSDAGEPAFADMVHGVEHQAAQLGLTLLLANSAEDAEREQRAVEALLARRVDGLILARAADSSAAMMHSLVAEKTPLVLMDRLTDQPVDQVGVKNEQAAAALTGKLISDGHRRIVMVAGDMRVATLIERRDGFWAAMGRAGLTATATLLEGATAPDLSSQLGQLLNQPDRPTAVIAGSTVLAAAVLTELRETGLQTPGDLAVAVFDGFAYSDLFSPQLTTVRQPAFDVGATAVGLLHRRLNDKSAKPRLVRLDPVIEYRDSTAPRSAGDH